MIEISPFNTLTLEAAKKQVVFLLVVSRLAKPPCAARHGLYSTNKNTYALQRLPGFTHNKTTRPDTREAKTLSSNSTDFFLGRSLHYS
jgi:hypothetical protein